ncbi:MAG: rod shape-determining protein MreD [Lautropia sp.]|nr:rod shape-determining protein MreD [Lautropia sp.]
MVSPRISSSSQAVPWLKLLGSLLAALLLNLCPWPDNPVIPDVVALTLLFWSIRQPRQTLLLLAFVLGLLMDTHLMSALGEHALSYTLITWLGMLLRRRMRCFGVPLQMLHVLLVLVAAQAMLAGARWVAGFPIDDPNQFLPALSTTLLWPLMPLLLGKRRRQPASDTPTAPYLRPTPSSGTNRYRNDG